MWAEPAGSEGPAEDAAVVAALLPEVAGVAVGAGVDGVWPAWPRRRNARRRLGRRAEGLSAAQEAVKAALGAGRRQPRRYFAALAMSVNTLTNQVDEAGRRAEGLAAAQEASAANQ